MTETVEVVAGNTLIQSTPPVQSLMGPTQVQELPLNNRNFVQLATLGARRQHVASRRSRNRADEHRQRVDCRRSPQLGQLARGRRHRTSTWAPTSPCLRPRRSNRSRNSRSSPAATPPSGRAAAAASSTSSPSPAATLPRLRLRVFPQRRAEREQLLPQAELRIRTTSGNPAPALDYNNFGFTIGGPVAARQALLLLLPGVAPDLRAPAVAQATVPILPG